MVLHVKTTAQTWEGRPLQTASKEEAGSPRGTSRHRRAQTLNPRMIVGLGLD